VVIARALACKLDVTLLDEPALEIDHELVDEA